MKTSRAIIRQFAKTAVTKTGEIHHGYFKLKQTQAKFQKADGKPVFLKGGMRDQVLYRFTMTLCLIAMGSMGKLFFELIVPKIEEGPPKI